MAGENFEFVCKDSGHTAWWYDQYTKQYFRTKRGGVVYRRIKGTSLPDPEILLKRRQEAYPDATLRDISPSLATQALWKHWNEIAKTPA